MISSANRTLRMTQTAILAAVTCILSYFMIPLAGLEISLAPLPIVIAAVMLGIKSSTFLGAVFGLISYLTCFTGQSAFGTLLIAENYGALRAFFVCVPTRILMGFLAGVIFTALKKKSTPAAVTCASVAAPVLNTVFFLGTLLLFFYKGVTLQGFMTSENLGSIWGLLIFLAGINAIVECCVCILLGGPISYALLRYQNRK